MSRRSRWKPTTKLPEWRPKRRIPSKYVRWDESGIHLRGNRSSYVRGETWLEVSSAVRKYLQLYDVCPKDILAIMGALKECTRASHEALQKEVTTCVCLPGRPAVIVYNGNRRGLKR